MRTVELFSGIGGFRVAAERAGLRTVWANDHDPMACAVYRGRFGEGELREGDIAEHAGDVPPHEVLTAGFPCQPFSSAGKKEGIRDGRGQLFRHIIAVLGQHAPRHFVLENVKRLLAMEGGRHFASILGELLGLGYRVEWRLLNAVHFGLPQNRERLFLIGERAEGGTPLRIRLASEGDLGTLPPRRRDAVFAPPLWRDIGRHGGAFPAWGVASRDGYCGGPLDGFDAALSRVRLSSVLQPAVADDFDFTEATLKWVHQNTPVNRFVNGVEILSNQKGGARMGYTSFGTSGVAPTLTSTTSRHYERYRIGGRYRRLTNVEYARIQGFPDDHCREAAVYEQYALYGNAVPPPVAAWVLRRLTAAGVTAERFAPHPTSLFADA